MTDAPRPARGLQLEEALERWSAPGAYAAMREYWDARVTVSGRAGFDPSPEVLRHQEFKRRREPIEEALLEMLRAGKLAASAVREDSLNPRIVVDPEVFGGMWIDYEFAEIVGGGNRLTRPEIFSPDAIPLNVRAIPDWYAQAFGNAPGGQPANPAPVPAEHRSVFTHSKDYRVVTLHGVRFSLTQSQARIVRRLHEAHVEGTLWVHSRDLLASVHFSSDKVAQIFRRHKDPHWQTLIESDRKGMYRLKIDE